MEKKLGRELAGYTPGHGYAPTVEAPVPQEEQAEKKPKKRQVLIAPSSPAESEDDYEDEPVVPQVAVKKPRFAPILKPVVQQAAEELKREEDKAALGIYRQRVDEAKRQLLMQAVFGGGGGVIPTGASM